ncbi:MAG: GNAT family N-acetyltransferase [Victivallaceae bacterium]|nr:GNAT family N-acetyltransferase [Victivallaceae bacterium]
MKIDLRIQKDGNREGVFPLLAKCFPEHWAPRIARGEARFPLPITSVIAECGEIIVGHCGIIMFEFYLGTKLWKAAGLCSVAVDPDYQGQGIAGKMFDHVLEYCQKNQIFFSPLYTGVPQVYEKRGWQLYKSFAPKKIFGAGSDFHSLYKNKLSEQQQSDIRQLYSNGFIFDGKIKRSELRWNALFANKSLYWCLTENAYALVIKDQENYILCESYSQDDCWDGLLSSGLLLSLPPTHPVLVNHDSIDSPIDIWHEEVVMVNIINSKSAEKAGLTVAIEQHSFFFPLPDKF